MANMSYCRFQNTLTDLRDCQNALDEGALDDSNLSEEEERAARALLRTCREMVDDYGEEND